MPAPRKFTAEQLRDAALAIVDDAGLEALTMRSLAARLGTGAMTIYNYVDGRDGLDGLVIAAVMTEAPEPAPAASDDWRDEVRAIAAAMWRSVRAHPNVIPLILTRRTLDGPTLDRAEGMLDALRRGGHRDFRLLVAFRAVTCFVVGFAQAELAGPSIAARGTDADTVLARAQALSEERYSGLREIAATTARTDRQSEFEAALDLVIAGLSAGLRSGLDSGLEAADLDPGDRTNR